MTMNDQEQHLALRSLWILRLAVAAAALLVQGCGETPASSYFPTAEGAEWIYEVTTDTDGKTSRDIQTIRSLGERSYEGEPVVIRRSELGQSIGVEYMLRVHEHGITRIGQRTDLEEASVLDEPPRTVLKLPLKQGVAWSTPTVPYTVLKKNEYPREIKYSKPILMTYTVESTDEQVVVPAGTFEHCARVQGQATLTLYTDPVNGFTKIPVTTNEWYCPGVGLTKLERMEKLATEFFSGGSVQMALVRYRVP